MSYAAPEVHRAYMREYNRKNREKILARQRELRAKIRDNGRVPKVTDPRWDKDPERIFRTLHVERRRCWVLWHRVATYKMGDKKYETPRVGLVVKPLDCYSSVVAIIPLEEEVCSPSTTSS